MPMFAWWARARATLVASWKRMRPARPAHYFSERECAQWSVLEQPAGGDGLDEQSWHDLLLTPYADMVAAHSSIFARQMLVHRLRCGVAPAQREQWGRQVRVLMQDTDQARRIRVALDGLRDARVEIAALLHGPAGLPALPRWSVPARGAPAALLLTAIAAAVLPTGAAATTALVLAIGLLALFLGLQVMFDEQIQDWTRRMRSLRLLLATSVRLGKLGSDECVWFQQQRGLPARLARQLYRLPMPHPLAEPLRDYLDWFFLGKIRDHFRQVRVLARVQPQLRELYLQCANLEANVALAHHLAQRERVCWSVASPSDALRFEEVVHPLLAACEPLTISMDGKGIFLTGQNGGGKSTLLRTVGINAIAARAFGISYARQACCPDLSVRASMCNQDSLLDGESLYISELRRARELLACSGPTRRLFLIDEIFRGTNYLESVAAAASFLHRLADHGLVIVSSHNQVLGPILAEHYTPRHVAQDEAGRLVLREGVLTKTNGISLLTTHGFDERIEANALKVWHWLSQYLSQPDGEVRILAGSEADAGALP